MSVYCWNPFLRFPRTCLILILLAAVPFLTRLANFRINAETRVLLEGDQRNLSSYEKVKQILADVEVIVISLEHTNLFTSEGLETVRRVSEALAQQPGVEDVKSLSHSVKPVRRGLSFEMIPLVPRGPYTTNQIETLRRFCLEHPLVRNIMVAADGRHSLITVTFRRDLSTPEKQAVLRHELRSALGPFEREGVRFQILALPLIEQEIRSTLYRDIKLFIPSAIGLLALVLWFTFRSGRILLLILANQLFFLLLLPGAIELSGFSVNVFTIMLFPLLIGVHLMLLAHIFSAWQRLQLMGYNEREAVEGTFKEVWKPSFFSALTTAIGLFSLSFTEVKQVRDFGLLGAFGMIFVFFSAFGPGMTLLALGTRGSHLSSTVPNPLEDARAGAGALPTGGGAPLPPEAEFISSGVLSRIIERYRNPIIYLTLASGIIIFFGWKMIRTDIRAVEFLSPQSPTRRAVEELDATYGGINVVQIEMDSGQTNGINYPAFLKYMERVQAFADGQKAISGTYSYAQLLAMMNQIWEGERPGSFRLPENPLLIQVFVLALRAQNFPFLTALCDSSFRTAYLVLRTRDMPSEQYLSLIEKIVGFAMANKPEGVTISASKGLHSILEADRRIIRSQLSSGWWSFWVIGFVLLLLWRSPVLVLFSLLTNAIPVALVIAAAGYAQIPLNSITVMVAAISLGIAVDDSIHFVTHWQEERRKDPEHAILNTLRVKGRPIISTSVILIAIFGVFWLSSFPPVVDFGILSALAFAGALLSVLLFLPAILLWWSQWKAPRRV